MGPRFRRPAPSPVVFMPRAEGPPASFHTLPMHYFNLMGDETVSNVTSVVKGRSSNQIELDQNGNIFTDMIEKFMIRRLFRHG